MSDGDTVGIDDLCRELSVTHERREECRLALKEASSLNAYLRKEEDRLEAESPTWWATLKAMLERKESIGLSMRKH